MIRSGRVRFGRTPMGRWGTPDEVAAGIASYLPRLAFRHRRHPADRRRLPDCVNLRNLRGPDEPIGSVPPPANDKWIPYRHPQPKDLPPELVIPNAIPTDERIWVPVEENVWFRPLLLAASRGYWMNLLRVREVGRALTPPAPATRSMPSCSRGSGATSSTTGLRGGPMPMKRQARPIPSWLIPCRGDDHVIPSERRHDLCRPGWQRRRVRRCVHAHREVPRPLSRNGLGADYVDQFIR